MPTEIYQDKGSSLCWGFRKRICRDKTHKSIETLGAVEVCMQSAQNIQGDGQGNQINQTDFSLQDKKHKSTE
jgi:hypothetical protein